MSWGNKNIKAAKADLRNARRKLDALPKAKRETPEFKRRNDAVIKAEKALPWYLR